MKSIKLFTKRLRITRNKKIIHRLKAQGHNKSKERPDARRAKRKPNRSQSPVIKNAIKNFK